MRVYTKDLTPPCGRDRVARLMGELELCGTRRRKPTGIVTTRADRNNDALPADLVKRNFTADRPNRLWVNDLTYVPIASGFAYTCFVTDACSTCGLPATWDHFTAGSASGMGPPPLPVMGPPEDPPPPA